MQQILFIGGTGIISSACARAVIATGAALTFLCRGRTDRSVPNGVELLHGDIRDHENATTLLEGRRFDVVVDWVSYTPAHVEQDVELFRGKTGQYVFISSASAYQT